MFQMPPGSAAAGPASIQQLAQNAAQNVLRRQRMKALLQAGASGAAGGSAVGGSRPIHSSFAGSPMGNRTSFRLPYQTLADLAQNARGSHAGFGSGGMLGGGGGGYDFSSLPNAADHHQSPASFAPPTPQQPAGQIGTAITGGPVGGQAPPEPYQQAVQEQGTMMPDLSGTSGPHGWVPLGGGLFYDPQTDMVRGGGSANAQGAPGLNPVDKRF